MDDFDSFWEVCCTLSLSPQMDLINKEYTYLLQSFSISINLPCIVYTGSWSALGTIVTAGTSATGTGVTLRAITNTRTISSNELIITESGISITDYCNHGIARCGELFTISIRDIVLLPLENGVWVVDLNSLGYSCIQHIVLTPSFPCRTLSLKGDSTFAPVNILCVNTNNSVLYAYDIDLDTTRNIGGSITTPNTLVNAGSPLPQDYLTLMTNIIDRDDFWYFFIGRDLYSINAIQGTVSVGEVSGLSGCDYVKYVVVVDIQGYLGSLYCNNSRVYEYDFMAGIIVREYDFPYYPCQDRDEYFYQNDGSSNSFFYRDEFIDITTSVPINTDHEFGICLGIRPIFVAIDKTQGALLVEMNPARITPLDSCWNSSCEVLLLYNRFFGLESLLIYNRDTQSGIHIDEYGDREKIANLTSLHFVASLGYISSNGRCINSTFASPSPSTTSFPTPEGLPSRNIIIGVLTTVILAVIGTTLGIVLSLHIYHHGIGLKK